MPLTKPRIEYIDVIKGFSILWVVIIHLPPMSLDWLYVGYRMPLFFFISGVFFRMRPFKVFFYRRINTLIVPFVFFYIITFFFAVVKYEVLAPRLSSVDYRYIGEFKEYAINFINLFKVSYDRINSPPMLINGALWFLIALFNIQMVYYALNKIIRNKYFLLSLCLIFHIIGKILSYYEINGLFYLAATSSFLIYYALGNIFISNLNEALNSRKKKYLLLIICLSILIPLSLLNPLSLSNYAGDTIVDKSIKNLLLNIRIVFFFPICFLFFKEIHQIIPLKLFRFFGRNSLVVLATHTFIISISSSIFIKIFKIVSPTEFHGLLLFNLVAFIMTLIVDYFLILLCTKYIPWFVGKKMIFKTKEFHND